MSIEIPDDARRSDNRSKTMRTRDSGSTARFKPRFIGCGDLRTGSGRPEKHAGPRGMCGKCTDFGGPLGANFLGQAIRESHRYVPRAAFGQVARRSFLKSECEERNENGRVRSMPSAGKAPEDHRNGVSMRDAAARHRSKRRQHFERTAPRRRGKDRSASYESPGNRRSNAGLTFRGLSMWRNH